MPARDNTKSQREKSFPTKRHASKMDERIGERIRARRTALGMSQTDLGKEIRLTFQQIQKYERGINRVSATTLLDIAAALRVNIGFFYDGLTDPSAANTDDPEDTSDADRLPGANTSHLERLSQRQDLLTLFRSIRNPRYRRHLIELAHILAEAESRHQNRAMA